MLCASRYTMHQEHKRKKYFALTQQKLTVLITGQGDLYSNEGNVWDGLTAGELAKWQC